MSCQKILDFLEIKRCYVDSMSNPNYKLLFSQFLLINPELNMRIIKPILIMEITQNIKRNLEFDGKKPNKAMSSSERKFFGSGMNYINQKQ